MGNQPARPNLTSHSASNWHWDTATDIFHLTIREEQGLDDQQGVYVLSVNIPFGRGTCREDIRIVTKEGVLTVYGRKPMDKEITSKTVKGLFAKYPNYTSFERNLILPNYVDASALEARWVHDGLLEIRIKKKEEKQLESEKQIEVGEMPTLTDPRYATPMIKQDYKLLASDTEDEPTEKSQEKKEKKEKEKQEKGLVHAEEKLEVEEIDASKAKPSQTVILPGANKDKKQQGKQEKPQEQETKSGGGGGGGGGGESKGADKGKTGGSDKEKPGSKKKVSKKKGG